MSKRPSAPPSDPIVITKPLDASSMTHVPDTTTTTTDEPLLLSVVEAAKLLGIGKTLAWDLVKAGEIPTIKLGTRRLVPRHEIVKMAQGEE